ncbi:hypothetical protein CVT24_006462 [Panaeolus cyanescens]|uniref:Uncharacterized protein n=1 Tax=Panaeolus cyanescens TaxID=181874 RepID=A0A409WIL5_9AGAR|nr:hypothetical protein CVT24_006462 [Panaeolus cyanescens]
MILTDAFRVEEGRKTDRGRLPPIETRTDSTDYLCANLECDHDTCMHEAVFSATSPTRPIYVYDDPPPYYGSISYSRPCMQADPEDLTDSESDTRHYRRRLHGAVIIITCLLCVGYFQIAILVKDYTRRTRHWEPGHIDWPIPSFVEVLSGTCTSGSRGWVNVIDRKDNSQNWGYRYSAETQFQIPLDEVTSLLLVSRGELSWGLLSVNVRSDTEPSTDMNAMEDMAIVTVIANYKSQRVMNMGICSVCRIRGLESTNESETKLGVGIFTPHLGARPSDPLLLFEIVVSLPKMASTRFLRGLVTDLYRTHHRLGDISMYRFGRVDLRTTHMGIEIGALYSNEVSIRTTDSYLIANLDILNLLSVDISNSPVDLNITMINSPERASKASLVTSNGPLRANFNLASTTTTDGTFHIDASTNNGAFELSFPEQPLDSKLYLKASSTGSKHPSLLMLNPAYEGTFEIHSLKHPELVYDPEMEDPSGMHRKRRFEQARYERLGLNIGEVMWEEGHDQRGKVDVVVDTSSEYGGVEVDFGSKYNNR